MEKKKDRKGQVTEPSPQSGRLEQPLTGVATTCSGCGEVLSVEVTGTDLLPLLKAGEALLEAYNAYATLRSLSPDKPIWSDACVASRIRDAEATVVRELRKLGRSEKYWEFVENCPPYVMSDEPFMAIDLIWAATCLQPLEALIGTGDFPRAVESRATKLEKAIKFLHAAVHPSQPPTEPAAREAPGRASSAAAYRFARQGEYWRVAFGGEPQLLKHHAGMEHIARLLAHPNPNRPLPAMIFFPRHERSLCLEHTSSPVLDAAAKLDYERRLQELREDEEEAKKQQDEKEQLRISEAMDAIKAELKSAVFQARDRELGPSSPAWKAADSVRKSIARARKYLEEAGQKDLAAHLKRAIQKRGESFGYYPQLPIPTWEL